MQLNIIVMYACESRDPQLQAFNLSISLLDIFYFHSFY